MLRPPSSVVPRLAASGSPPPPRPVRRLARLAALLLAGVLVAGCADAGAVDTGAVDTGSGPAAVAAPTTDVTTTPAPTVTPSPTAAPASTSPTTTSPTTTSTTRPPRPPGPPPVVSAIDTTDNVVFITIDDGAVRDPAVVAYLREKGWPVSIFPTQQFLDADPAFFQDLHGLGATIENHSVSHPDLRRLSRAEQQRQICGPVEPIRQRFGAAPRLFRPPYGVYNPTTIEVAGSCGYDAIVLWRADVWEGNMDVQSGDLRAGDIVLFHFRPDLLRSLQAFDRYMAERQLQPGRLEQYLPAAAR